MICAAGVLSSAFTPLSAFDLSRALGGLGKAVQAMSLSDSQVAGYVGQAVSKMDAENTVLPESSPYTKRLRRITSGLTSVDGIPLNFKVYKVDEVNAFACADGSVRVYTGIMDLMSDDELLGVIGHEIGHVAEHHSKNAMRTALLTSAAKDAVGSAGGLAAKLSDSQLGELSESLVNSKYSQKQETEADDYGYDFLKSNGKNPWAMAMAFSKLQQMENAGGTQQSSVAKMFSSHPDTQSRVQHMAERATKDGFARPSSGSGSTSNSSKSSKSSKSAKTTKNSRTAKTQTSTTSVSSRSGGLTIDGTKPWHF